MALIKPQNRHSSRANQTNETKLATLAKGLQMARTFEDGFPGKAVGKGAAMVIEEDFEPGQAPVNVNIDDLPDTRPVQPDLEALMEQLDFSSMSPVDPDTLPEVTPPEFAGNPEGPTFETHSQDMVLFEAFEIADFNGNPPDFVLEFLF